MATRLLLLLLPLLLVAPSHGSAEPRNVVATLEINSPFDLGVWGRYEYCQDTTYASSLRIRFKDYTAMDVDETAVNAVWMDCRGHYSDEVVGYVSSTVGSQGDWQDTQTCTNGFVTGLRAQVLAPQPISLDNVAVQNVQLECNYGEQILPGVTSTQSKIPEGTWSVWAYCREGTAVCGLTLRYDEPNLYNDDAAIVDINMFCCELEGLTTTAADASL